MAQAKYEYHSKDSKEILKRQIKHKGVVLRVARETKLINENQTPSNTGPLEFYTLIRMK